MAQEVSTCNVISDKIELRQELEEDEILTFFSLIIDAMESDEKFPESVLTKDKIKALINADLCEMVDTAYAYDEYMNMSPQQAFEIGACWGACKILQEAMHEHREPQREQVRRRIVRDNAKLFKLISENPGISTTELCEELDLSVGDIINYEWKINEKMVMIVTLISGNEKRYYLSTAAQESYNMYVKYLQKKAKRKQRQKAK